MKKTKQMFNVPLPRKVQIAKSEGGPKVSPATISELNKKPKHGGDIEIFPRVFTENLIIKIIDYHTKHQ